MDQMLREAIGYWVRKYTRAGTEKARRIYLREMQFTIHRLRISRKCALLLNELL